MTETTAFPALSPEMARERFLLKDESWDARFKANFNQFIIASVEYSRPVMRFPVPPSRTENHALFLVTGGQIEMTVGHRAYTLSAQALLIIPALQIFSIDAISEDATGFMCFFSPTLLLSTSGEANFDFLKLTSQPLVSLTPFQTSYLTNLCTRLTNEYAENGATKTDLIRAYLLALLTDINYAYVSTASVRIDAGDRLVQGFMDLLNRHIRQKRFVANYADLLNISPNHLNKVVKSRTGQSPSVWIDERIVLEAKVWLFQSDLTIAQIATELGFDDQSAFGKLFRKYAGISPTTFRNQYIRKND